MLNARFHPGAAIPTQGGEGGEGAYCPERLGLLLGYAGWRQHTWADNLPALLAPMGITAHRATSGKQASAIIASTPIHIAFVDLGLPLDDTLQPAAEAAGNDQGGPRLLEILRRLPQPPPTVVIKRSRSARDDQREVAAALKLGAFAVIDPPRSSPSTSAVAPSTGELEVFLEVLRRILFRHYQGRWPTPPSASGGPVPPPDPV